MFFIPNYSLRLVRQTNPNVILLILYNILYYNVEIQNSVFIGNNI